MLFSTDPVLKEHLISKLERKRLLREDGSGDSGLSFEGGHNTDPTRDLSQN